MRLPFNFDEFAQFATGATASFFFDHFARYALNPMPAYVIWDNYVDPITKLPAPRYVWGYGLNNGMTLGAGAAIYAVGKYKKKEQLKNFGKGWLFYTILDKFIVQPMQYNYVINPPPKIQAMGATQPMRIIQPGALPQANSHIVPASLSKYTVVA